MPRPTYSWQTDDYLTANLLNGELYRANGNYGNPNGIGFHGQKPFYIGATFNVPTAGATGTWNTMAGPFGGGPPSGNYTVVADSAGFTGARLDPQNNALLNGGGIWAGGGNSANPGGLALAIANMPFTLAGAGNGFGQVGFGAKTISPNTGQVIGVYNNTTGIASSMDIVDLNGNTAGWFMDGVGGMTPGISPSGTDNSGQAGRIQAAWMSAYPGIGTTVGALPAPTQNWTGSTSLTAALMNAQIAATLNLLNMPPLLRVRGSTSATTSVPNSTVTTINMGTPTWDTYSGWASGTNTYTAPLKGAYLVYLTCAYNSGLGNTGLSCGVKINGTSFSGPVNYPLSTASGCMKVQVFDLNAGDTIQPWTEQFSGSTVSTSNTTVPVLVVLYLSQTGALPIAAPVDADPTYMFTAGTPASSMPGLMNAHITNDLALMTYRPYCMAWQGTAQTGVSDGSVNGLTLQQVNGIVHGSNGDPYSGFSGGVYTAPIDGYYLLVQETAMAVPALTVSPRIRVGFQVAGGGTSAQDWYQLLPEHIGGTSGGGAAAFGIYYLRAGNTAQPVFTPFATSGTTTGTSTVVLNSHFEAVYLGG